MAWMLPGENQLQDIYVVMTWSLPSMTKPKLKAKIKYFFLCYTVIFAEY